MFVLLVLLGTYKLCSAVAWYLRVYAPTNIALDFFRSRRGLKWALPAALVVTPMYWGAGYAVTTLIDNGGPGWLNLLAALCAWNGIKFALMGVWSPVLLSVAAFRRTERVRIDPGNSDSAPAQRAVDGLASEWLSDARKTRAED